MTLLAGILAVSLLLCWIHGVGEGDEHSVAHASCAPMVALPVAAVVPLFLGAAGWLLASLVPTLATVSLHLADPPPKHLARS